MRHCDLMVGDVFGDAKLIQLWMVVKRWDNGTEWLNLDSGAVETTSCDNETIAGVYVVIREAVTIWPRAET